MTCLRFEVLTVVCVKLKVFPVVLFCSLVDRYKYLGGKCFFHLQGIGFWIQKSLWPHTRRMQQVALKFWSCFYFMLHCYAHKVTKLTAVTVKILNVKQKCAFTLKRVSLCFVLEDCSNSTSSSLCSLLISVCLSP